MIDTILSRLLKKGSFLKGDVRFLSEIGNELDINENLILQSQSPQTTTFPTPPATCSGYEFSSNAELVTAVNLWISNNAQAIIDYGQINTWCTGNVTSMSELFQNKATFNDDISN